MKIIDPAVESSPPRRPLVVRLRNWVGDVILGVPALRLLQSHGYTLQLVGRGWAPDLLQGEGWPVQVHPRAWRERVAQLRALRAQGAESALVLPTSFSSALEVRLAGLRGVGYRHEARHWLMARSFELPTEDHELERYWRLACRFLGVDATPPARIALATSAAHQQEADALVSAHRLHAGFVLLCPFAGGQVEKQDKKWPAFAEFARALLERGSRVVVCPGPGEETEVESWDPRVIRLCGVRLGPYGGLLRRATLMASNDTGPAHLAAAVDARVLSVLGPTRPEQWAPWGPTVTVVRRWPGWPTVDEVLAAAGPLLEAGR